MDAWMTAHTGLCYVLALAPALLLFVAFLICECWPLGEEHDMYHVQGEVTHTVDMDIRSVDDIVQAARKLGSHFFDPESMRFFGSRILSTYYGEGVFVTSEQHRYTDPRLYTVRRMMPDGSLDTVGEFQQHATAARAATAAQRHVRELRAAADDLASVEP